MIEYSKRPGNAEIIIAALLIFSTLASLCIGPYRLSPAEVLESLLTGTSTVIWNIRLPRVITALLVGASLAVSGAVMQCILRNPLASPFTLGISQGAAFGAAFAIIYLGAGMLHRTGESITILNPYLVPLFAFLGSLISVFVILLLARLRDMSPEAMILAGVAMASLFQASTMLMQYFTDDVKVASVVFWTFGDMGRTNWNEIFLIFSATSVCMFYFMLRRMDYNALTLSDETATSLGVNCQRVRLESLLLASFLTAVCVSFTGIVGFVGLVAPHSIRISITGDYRRLIPLSTAFGATFLLIADTFGRSILLPVMIPVGIVTAFIGAPAFIYLLLRGWR
ncbi:FecCD family ABC transporter permease [Archaeoglobus neptunius]|uniref:FecCD family ABC transporter permease n=1 Tax=Archaeoglobus neptunius TaxID=2798580 RepID=UPI0019262C49|nr:iron ABC transporter permease [Archaeoglobus neptunius]